MSLVNVKVKYIRPKYNDLREWMSNEKNVYIGRANVVFIDGQRFPDEPSEFANPFKVGKDGTREEVIQKYELYIREELKNNNELVNKLKTLKNKTLGCWCKPEPCHGNVLLKIIKEIT